MGLESADAYNGLNKYSRHFFVPHEWVAGSRHVICSTSANGKEIAFGRNGDVVVVVSITLLLSRISVFPVLECSRMQHFRIRNRTNFILGRMGSTLSIKLRLAALVLKVYLR